MGEHFVGDLQGITLASPGMTNVATTLTVSSATNLPPVNFRIRIDDEVMLVTNVAGTTLTVTRAAEAVNGVQTAVAHSTGAPIYLPVTDTQFENMYNTPTHESVIILPPTTSTIAAIIRGLASHSGDLIEFQDNGSRVLAYFDKAGRLNQIGIAAPGGLSVTNGGTAGTTTYNYWVVARDQFGNKITSARVQTTTGNATLTSTNKNTISWTAVPGASTYDVLKTNISTSLATGLAVTTVDDTGQATAAYTAPTSPDESSNMAIDGQITASSGFFSGQAGRQIAPLVVQAGGNAGLSQGAGGNSNDIFTIQDSSGTRLVGISELTQQFDVVGGSSFWSAPAMRVFPNNDAVDGIRIVQHSGTQTADLFSARAVGGSTILLRVNKAGYLGIVKNAAPADADVANSEVMPWWDATNKLLNIKGKDGSGVVSNQVFLGSNATATGAWQTRTPTLTNFGTVSLNTQSYLLEGKKATVIGTIALSAALGAGTPTVNLPVAAVTRASFSTPGTAVYGQTGTRNWVGTCIVGSAGTTLTFQHTEAGNNGNVDAANPFTWASTHTIFYSIVYESA